MKYIEAPNTIREEKAPQAKTLFLAGGITGCPDWQQVIVSMLQNVDLILFNPRRKDFPIHDPNAAFDQIKWEHEHLRIADEILFWFPYETLCPIVLYELGAWTMTDKRIYVGVHPQYQRRQDVEIQTSLCRPDINIVYTLESLANLVLNQFQP